MVAGGMGCILLGGVVSTELELPAISYPGVTPTATYTVPAACYPEARTASAAPSYYAPTEYAAADYPQVTPPTISAPDAERPPEPKIEVEVEYR